MKRRVASPPPLEWASKAGAGRGGVHAGKHAHHCCLHPLEGMRELRVGCNKVVNSNVLLDQRVGKVVKGRSDLACLVLFLSHVGAKYSFACRHAVDVVNFGKRCRPVGFPVGPGVVGNGLGLILAGSVCYICRGLSLPFPTTLWEDQ